jgi:ABC-type cobalamin/Fe3+-siderophores transport system ATPase subunit
VGELLEVVGVCKGFSRAGVFKPVLEDVSFGVGAGEVVAVVGERLAGKSTLLKIVAGLRVPDEGMVSFRGEVLKDLSDRQRERLLGEEIVWLNRDLQGPDVRVRRYVGWAVAVQRGLGRRDAVRIADRALERVGASGCAGSRWVDISDAQRVLVGLARGFAGSPGLVVVDDLLDGLRGRAAEEVSDLLRELVEESEPSCGVLFSASEIDSALCADRVWALTRKGRLTIAFDPPPPAEAEIIHLHNRGSERSRSVG